LFSLQDFSFRHGFAARCEEWLCLSVELAFPLGYASCHCSPRPAYGYRGGEATQSLLQGAAQEKRASLTEKHSHSSQQVAKPIRTTQKDPDGT